MTSDVWKARFGPQGDDGPPGQDHDLAILDPGHDDPGYWFRFRSLVMARVADELTRRRLAEEMGVAGLLQSWSGTVIRAAAIAAVIAGVLFLRGQATPEWGVEEALTEGLEDSTLPQLMEQSEGADPFLFVEVTF